MTFPAHQGLILPVVRKWPKSFDALALSVGAAMPDITDTILGFPLNGYFRQWYGHSLLGIFTLDLFGGVFITWLIAFLVGQLLKSMYLSPPLPAFLTKAARALELIGKSKTESRGQDKLRLWSFSVMVGILSHIGFDIISHTTNLLLYPWYENLYWFPTWWYTVWIEIPALSAFGRTYLVGVHTVIWGLLTMFGIFLFLRFLSQEYENRNMIG